MRRTVLILNLIVVVFFLCFFAYTFLARSHLDSLAREFVTVKTLEYSKPLVAITKAGLDSPLAKQFVSEEDATAIRKEVANYERDPESYVANLTHGPIRNAAVVNENVLAEKAAAIKLQIRDYYDTTLNELIVDLRIFSISNLVAGLIAFGIAYQSRPDIGQSIIWFSFLMFVAVLYCSYMYLDDLTFFRILLRSHMGWWYAVMLILMTIALYLDYGRQVRENQLTNTVR